MISNAVHLLTCLLVIYLLSLEKCLFESSAHFLVGLFFDVEFFELFIYFEYEALIGYVICNYLLPLSRLFLLS